MLRNYFGLPKTIYVLCLGTLINRAGSFVIIFLTLYLSDELGFGEAFAAWCIGFFGAGAIFASLVGGQLADQLGRRPVLIGSLLGGAATLVWMSSLETQTEVAFAVFFFGIVSEMYRPAAMAVLGDVCDEEHRPHAFGLLYVSINLGFALGAIVGGFLISHFEFHVLFYADALTMAAYGVVVFLAIPESAFQNREGGESKAPARIEVAPLEALRRISGDAVFLLFCLCCLLNALVFHQMASTLPLYMKSHGHSADTYGCLIAVNGGMIVLLQLPVGEFFSRYSRSAAVIAGFVLAAIGFGMFGLGHGLKLFVLGMAVLTAGEIIQAPFLGAIVTDLAPQELRGRYQGVFSMTFSCGLAIGSPIGGEILAKYGGETLWGISFVVCLISAALCLTIRRQIEKSPPPCEEEEDEVAVATT
ncbi:MAG: MFS transporter [Planctomycetota bacterium]